MIYLDSTTRKIEVKLDISASTSIPQALVCYYDVPANVKNDFSEYRGASQSTTLSGSGDFTICSAPPVATTVRTIEHMCVHNRHTASADVIVKMDDSGAETYIVHKTLATGQSLVYEDGAGWQTV